MKAGLAGAFWLLWLGAASANPDALYGQMRECLAEARLNAPCVAVDLRHEYVVIKDHDPAKPAAYLIVPSFEVTGIEDPAVFRAPVVGFWSIGWAEGERLLRRPADEIGLAINSKAERSQNLLHIHISCVRPELREALAGARIGANWAVEPFVLVRDHAYNARRIASLETSPFLLLRELPSARRDMAAQSLAVIGAHDGGYFLLQIASRKGEPAAAEELLDETCGQRTAAR